MKASELIEKLEKAIKKYGDKEVCYCNDTITEIITSVDNVIYNDNEEESMFDTLQLI